MYFYFFGQVEFANVVILNKTDLMTKKDIKSIRSLISKMNPRANVVESSYAKIDCKAVLSTGSFSVEEAEEHEMWLKEARVGEHKPESEEYGVRSFVFKARKPFHPKRLWDAMKTFEKKKEPFHKVVRAKGTAWLATRHTQGGELSIAGRIGEVIPGPEWWDAISKCSWPKGLKEEIGDNWHPDHGDRHSVSLLFLHPTNDRHPNCCPS